MRTLIQKTCLPFLFLTVSQVYAQQGTVAAGAEATGAGTVSFSVGQVVCTYIQTGTHNINEGLQQPYEFYTLGTDDPSAGIEASVFPNPATSDIFLEMKGSLNNDMFCRLYDEQGKLIITQSITGPKTTIHTAHLANATYILKVMENDRELAGFKLIKH